MKKIIRETALFGAASALYAAAIVVGLAPVTPETMVPGVRLGLFVAAYLLAGYGVLAKALGNFVRGGWHRISVNLGSALDENFLMTAASLGAFAIGEWAEAAAVMIFYRIGELLQERAVEGSMKSITALLDLKPETALVAEGGEWVLRPAADVAVGSVLRVAAGERIPVDAVVLRGEGGIDEAMLTGEAQPRMVRAGDELSSGTLCLDAALELRTIRTADKSNAARIIDMVWNAAQAKARPEKFISSFARIYTPLVLLGAALLAVLPPLLFQQPFSEWFSRSLILLVISCPCALVVSVPLTYFAGIGGLSSRGILVKGAVHIDTLRKIRYAAFDKTGTLTWGRFEVLGVEPAQGMRVEELTGMAAAAESLSRHPVARAICRNFDALGVAGDVREIAGRGVEAAVNGVAVLAGSRGLLEERGVIVSETAGSLGTAGTEVFVAAGGRYLGRVVLGDGLKEGAAEALAALRGLGVEELLCFTGDGAASAEAALGGLNLDGIVSGLSPAGKIAALEGLLAKGSVLFVGDGINDAPVLARADLGVAMGRSAADVNASDAALEAADVIVASGDLRRIPEALARARKIHQVVMENVAFALTAKLVFLALAVLGLTGMWAALVADVGVCLAAVLHSLRARRG